MARPEEVQREAVCSELETEETARVLIRTKSKILTSVL
jgi:hypothetical protein